MNWKYILIVFILAAVVGGGIMAWQYRGILKSPEEKIVGEEIPYPEKVNNIES